MLLAAPGRTFKHADIVIVAPLAAEVSCWAQGGGSLYLILILLSLGGIGARRLLSLDVVVLRRFESLREALVDESVAVILLVLLDGLAQGVQLLLCICRRVDGVEVLRRGRVPDPGALRRRLLLL